MQTTGKILGYINYSNAKFISAIHPDLRSRHPLGLCRNLGNPRIENTTLVGVREIFTLEDLNLPVLLNERVDAESIVLVRDTVDEREYGCAL